MWPDCLTANMSSCQAGDASLLEPEGSCNLQQQDSIFYYSRAPPSRQMSNAQIQRALSDIHVSELDEII